MGATAVTVSGGPRRPSSASSLASSWSSFSSWGSGPSRNAGAPLRRRGSIASALRSWVPRSSNPDQEAEQQQDTGRRTSEAAAAAAASPAPGRRAAYVPQYAAASFLQTSTSRPMRKAPAPMPSMAEKMGDMEEDGQVE